MTLQNLYETYVVPQLPRPLQQISDQISDVLYQAYPLLSQTISFATNLANSSESSLLSLGILLITLYVGLRIANYIRQTIFGWIMLGVKLVLLLLLFQAVVYVNSYGLEKAIRDSSWAGGLLWGFIQEAMDGNNQQNGRQPRGMRSRSDEYNYRRQQSQYNPGRGRNRWS